ncbi:dienelactone hydrolase family protein [Streptomyces sp. NPDC047737]|uniref:dienelactone hydrolase family protein n=1 Tax=unclassified Streptomyces TaxID=2593676 RepID=UPI0033FC8F28
MSLGLTQGALPAFHERLRDELTFPLSWERATARDFPAWRARARAVAGESLLQPAGPGPEPFDPVTVEEHRSRAYTGRTVEFALSRYGRARGSLLVPNGVGPFPAVLLLHDHGSEFTIGREKLVRPRSDPARLALATRWADRHYDGRFIGDDLAARGYVVLAVDTLGWGDRGPLAYEDQQALAANLMQLGTSAAGLAAHEDIRAAAFLGSLPEVDGRRVGALGFSMGAFRAWQLSALTDGVRAAAAVCWMTGLKELMLPGGNALRGQSAYFMLHPGLHRHLDLPDVASLAAPKPALFLSGGRDHLFTPAGVRTAYAKLRAVWEAAGAGDRLTTTVWPETGHAFTAAMQDEVHAWLDTWLGTPAGSGPGPGGGAPLPPPSRS